MEKTNEVLWKEYHDSGREDALTALIQNNMGMVKKCAKDWHHAYGVKNVEKEDLESEGIEAIIIAAKTYDPERGTMFITHATNTINARMQRYMFRNAGLVRMPEDKIRMLHRINRCRPEAETVDYFEWYERVCQKYDVVITYEHFCALVQLEVELGGYSSLNELLGEDQSIERQELMGATDSAEDIYMDLSLREEIEECLEMLNEREQYVLECFFGLDGNTQMTLKEIAVEMGLSTATVGEIKNRALWKLNQSTKVNRLREYI